MKVLLSCPVNSVTGYGTDGIELAQALVEWGADVYLHPSSVVSPLPADVAVLLTKPIPRKVDLILSHRCPQELARGADAAGLLAESTLRVAWTMWEWDSLANVDEVDQNTCEHSFQVFPALESALKPFDVVLAYDEISQMALQPHHPSVDILQGGCTPLAPMTRNYHDEFPFRFLMTGALTSRKNPFAAINAFRSLRLDGELKDAQLVLKTTRPGLHPAMESWTPGLRIINEVWPAEQLHALYRECHALLAPSWGEGKNRPAIEFATSGGAVAATAFGGHRQWLSSDYAWPLRFDLVETSPGARGARVDQEHLQEVMLALYQDRAETSRRAAVAARVLPGMVAWPRVLERLSLRLRDVAGDRGAEVSALMRACRRPEKTEDSLAHDLMRRSAFDGILS